MKVEEMVPVAKLLLTDFDGAWGAEPIDEPGIPVIRSTDMRGGILSLQGAERRAIPASIVAKKRLLDGDILVTKSSGSAHLVGASVLFKGVKGEDCVCSNFTRCLRPNPTMVIPEYLYFGLQSPQFKEKVFGAQRTTSGLRNLKIDEFKSGELRVPSLVEQRRVVNRIHECLGRVDEITSLRSTASVEANQLASSLYAAIANEGEWPIKTVGDVVTRSRNGKSIRQDNENATGHVLSLSAVHDVSLDLTARKPVVLSDAFAEQYRICDGDVFVSRSNTRELVGLSSVAVHPLEERLIYPDLLIKLEVDTSQVLPRYLAYVLRTHESRHQIKERSVGTSQSMVKISGERLKEVVIPVPPIDVQKSLVERFDELHDLTAQLVCEMKAPEQERLRESILRKAFEGEM